MSIETLSKTKDPTQVSVVQEYQLLRREMMAVERDKSSFSKRELLTRSEDLQFTIASLSADQRERISKTLKVESVEESTNEMTDFFNGTGRVNAMTIPTASSDDGLDFESEPADITSIGIQ